MKNLIEAKNTTAFLKAHEISAKKRYGQNFLIDRLVLDKIIAGSDIGKDDLVLEIGPGIGTMTQALCEAAKRVIAVEIDRDMLPLLKENLADCDNYEIINADIMKLDLKGLLTEEAGGAVDKNAEGSGTASEGYKHIRVAANLPYYITTPIIMKLLEERLPVKTITVMVQKEVADRMQARPGGKDYGALTLAVQYYSDAEVIAKVPPNSFIPRPGVDSAVIRLSCHKNPPIKAKDEKKLFEIIRAAFSQRRKTLANALKNCSSLGLSRERTEEVLKEMGLSIDIRGERLSLSEFARLTDRLFSD